MSHSGKPPTEAMIVMGMVGLGCMAAVYIGSHKLTQHNDVSFNRNKRYQFLTEPTPSVVPRTTALNIWDRISCVKDQGDDNKL